MHYGIAFFPTEYTLQPGDLAVAAEERGFESIWFPEHTHIPVSRRSPWPGGPDLPREYVHSYDLFIALTAAGAATREIKLGAGVCLVVERDPIVTAKEVASLDNISGGRVLFGVGAGWNTEEMENHGTDPRRRFGLLRERVLAMREIWMQDEAEYHGRYVDFDKIWSYPKPLQKPLPVFMGGDGSTTFDRVVEFCEGWMPISRAGRPPPGLEDKVPELRRRAAVAGRDPDSISVSIWACPPTREVIDTVERLGIERVIFLLPSAEPPEVRARLDEYATLIA